MKGRTVETPRDLKNSVGVLEPYRRRKTQQKKRAGGRKAKSQTSDELLKSR
jgi:hypothetical protein